MPTIHRALISVSDKTGIVAFATVLQSRGVQILSTGGTAAALRQAGIAITDVAEYTGAPEMLDGRVKTLHPKIHGGILAIRDRKDHHTTLAQHGILTIDLVVVNLYPFQQTVARLDLALPGQASHGVGGAGAVPPDVIEQIDIGGPSMLRSAAKNHHDVVVVCDPADYPLVTAELERAGAVTPDTARALAQKVFQHTAQYDAAIAQYLATPTQASAYPDRLLMPLEKVRTLRYGENPHQRAAWYRAADAAPFISEPLQGKEISYNNLLDADAAIACARAFSAPAVCIVKHTNPCGVGVGATIHQAYERALTTDPTAAFGGIVACNHPVDRSSAELMAQTFFEVICAPAFSDAARTIFATKKNLRLVTYDAAIVPSTRMRSACGGYLLQDADTIAEDPATWKVVSARQPTVDERAALGFAWTVAKHVQSNAIVFTDAQHTLGIGAGQMSRVDAVKVATMKMQTTASSVVSRQSSAIGGFVAASDAFFPFRDGVDAIATSGATAIIQPGGSVRDDAVIAAANEHHLAMLFTDIRHFRH